VFVEGNQRLLEAAQPLYSDELPYHNFSHVQDTLEAADTLLDRCEEYDVDIDEEVVYAALDFHDALYHVDHRLEGFATKEDLSKHVAENQLEQFGYDDEFINEVTDCIEATKHSAEPETKEQIAVRAADLRGLMGSEDEFLSNTEALWEEQKVLKEDPDRQEWINGTYDVLVNYLSQDLELTPEHDTEEGVSEFHTALAENINSFKQEYLEE
jgi:hypothetical protein